MSRTAPSRDQLIKRAEESIDKLARAGVELGEEERKIVIEATEILAEALEEVRWRDVPGHELEHSFRVLELSLLIWWRMGKPGDARKLIFAALLHDVGRLLGGEHESVGAKVARRLLEDKSPEIAGGVARIIREHSWKAGRKPSCIESAILQDADRIDALGAVGVARVFAYGGYLGRPVYGLGSPSSGSLKHFEEKILKLPEFMNTEPGREIAERRAEFVRRFLDEFMGEINLIR